MRALRSRALRVPRIIALFWVIKFLSTAMGESASDALVHGLHPVPAVLVGFVGFVAGLAVQLTRGRYVAWAYWLAVCMVGIFGTMAADVLHVGFGVPYIVSTVLYALVLATVFVVWFRIEGTLSIHDVDSFRRECFYWAAVVATFAMGTALGDLAATTLGLGYGTSIVVFAVLILIPALGYRFLRWNAVPAFWCAYVMTRPLGASVADWIGKPPAGGGLGVGAGRVAVCLAALIVCLVAYLAITREDVQPDRPAASSAPGTASPPAVG